MLHHHAKIKFVALQDIEQEVEYFIIVLFKEKNVKEYKKRTCWNRKTKNLKRGKCITRSCCIQRLIHKKLKKNY